MLVEREGEGEGGREREREREGGREGEREGERGCRVEKRKGEEWGRVRQRLKLYYSMLTYMYNTCIHIHVLSTCTLSLAFTHS